jgi:hypothetical protein
VRELCSHLFVRTLIIIAGLAGAIGSVFVHPSGEVKDRIVDKKIAPAVFDHVSKSCLNCHSNNTSWPWYSYVAPMSWMVERDVSRGRARMNLSRWEEYSADEKIGLLTAMGAAIRTGIMPPPRYTLMHPDAKLSAAQRDEIYRWTQAERQRLREEGKN